VLSKLPFISVDEVPNILAKKDEQAASIVTKDTDEPEDDNDDENNDNSDSVVS